MVSRVVWECPVGAAVSRRSGGLLPQRPHKETYPDLAHRAETRHLIGLKAGLLYAKCSEIETCEAG